MTTQEQVMTEPIWRSLISFDKLVVVGAWLVMPVACIVNMSSIGVGLVVPVSWCFGCALTFILVVCSKVVAVARVKLVRLLVYVAGTKPWLFFLSFVSNLCSIMIYNGTRFPILGGVSNKKGDLYSYSMFTRRKY